MTKPTDKNVPIKIDNTPHKSPNPTTGAALYILGKIETGYDLWRETKGKGDDEFISNNNSPLQLEPGDHFYSAQSTLNPGGLTGCDDR